MSIFLVAERRLEEVLAYEFGGLGNTDILHYLDKTYDTQLVNELADEEDCDDLEELAEERSLAIVQQYDYFGEEVIALLNDKFGEETWYALWLTTEDECKRIYGGRNGDIDQYIIQDDWIPISDLGPDGILFAMKELPEVASTI